MFFQVVFIMVVMSHTETFRRTQSAGAVPIVVTNSSQIEGAGALDSNTSIDTSITCEELSPVSGPLYQQTNSAKNSVKTEAAGSEPSFKENERPNNDGVLLWRSVSETSSLPKPVVIPSLTPSQSANQKESVSFPSLPDIVLKHLGLMVQNERENYSELDVENRFIALSLAFKTDLLTLSSRLELQKRHRDQAEINMVAEVNILKNALYKLSRNYIDSDSIEALTQIQAQVDVLQQATDKVSGTAELFGAVQQEHRLSRATEVLVSHVENVKRSLDKMSTELEEVKRVLAENNIIMEDGSDLPDEPAPRTVRYRSLAAITAKKLNAKRRASIAAMPRPISSPNDASRSLTNQLSQNSSPHLDGRPRGQMANVVNSMRLKSALLPIYGDSQDSASDVTDSDVSEKLQESMGTLEEVPEAQRDKPTTLEDIASEVNNNLNGDNIIHESEDEIKTLPRLSIAEVEESPGIYIHEKVTKSEIINPIKLIRWGIIEKIFTAKTIATIYVRDHKSTILRKIRVYVASLLCAAAAWFIIWIFVPQS